MKKAGLYVALALLSAFGLLGAIRAVELMIFGGFSSYNAGRITGSVVLAILCLWGSRKVYAKVRSL